MKIGILTFHCAHNYGAVLQCYALQEFLKSLGHEVFVIDYRPKYLTDYYKLHKLRHWQKGNKGGYSLKSITRECIRFNFRKPRYVSFQNFISEYLHLFPYSSDCDFSNFDAMVFGSDQIWNSKITGKSFDPVFFGEGIKCRKIVYAASNKNNSLTEDEERFYSQVLPHFYQIGVRETTLQGLLQPLTQKKVHLNIDPSLLVDCAIFEKLAVTPDWKSKYVMIYEISPHAYVYDMAKKYATAHHFKVMELSAQIQTNRFSERDMTASPNQWVGYIKKAELVLTTSFHGVAFSILFKKKFYYIRQHTPSDYRIESLLKQLNIENRILEQNREVLDSPIDYVSVHQSLDKLREESCRYLCDALK